MEREGIQANELAERLGISEGAISNWRAGRNGAKGKMLRRLAEALGRNPDWLIGSDAYPEPGATTAVLKETDNWRARATAAEKQLADLRQALGPILHSNCASAEPSIPGIAAASGQKRVLGPCSNKKQAAKPTGHTSASTESSASASSSQSRPANHDQGKLGES